MAEEKSFKPTKKRLEKARREGQVLKSQYLSQVVVIIAVILTAWVITPRIWVGFKMLLEYGSTNSGHEPLVALTIMAWETFWAILILGGIGSVAAMLSEAAQVGFRIEVGVLAPRSDRVSLSAGFKRISGTGTKQVLLMMLRATLLVGTLTMALVHFPGVLTPFTDLHTGMQFTNFLLVQIVSAGIMTSMALAALDYFLMRRAFYRDLSMSHQDLRDENKNDEGDPMMKAARRSLHESLALQDLVRRVRTSKVVVVERAKTLSSGERNQ